MPTEITHTEKSYSLEVIPDLWGGYRYRLTEIRAHDQHVMTATIIVSDYGDSARGTLAYMIVHTKKPGNTKHMFRVDEDIPVSVARHIIGCWVALSQHPEPVPFPEEKP